MSDARGEGSGSGGGALRAAGVCKFETLAAACCDPRLARGDLAVFAVLVDRFNLKRAAKAGNAMAGAAFGSADKIAEDAEVHRVSAFASLRKLQQLGYVQRISGSGPKANRYIPTLLTEAPSSSPQATGSEGATSSEAATPVVATPLLGTLAVVAPGLPEPFKREPRKEPRNQSRASALDEQAFAEFWSVYPKRVEKVDAMKVFRRLKPAEIAAAIADVKRRNAAEWAGKDDHWIPGPAKYLRGRRWEDEPPTKTPTARPFGQTRNDLEQQDYTAGIEAPP